MHKNSELGATQNTKVQRLSSKDEQAMVNRKRGRIEIPMVQGR
jgi:hypothetical protein